MIRVLVFGLAFFVGASLTRVARATESDCPEQTRAPPAMPEDCLRAPPGGKLAPDLEILKTPDTPALSTLGLTGTVVGRPATPTGAAVTLATGIASGLVNPGQSMAFEFAPFWLFDHPRLTVDDLEKKKWPTALHTASLSFATAPTKVDTPQAATAGQDAQSFALGLRTTLLNGRRSPAAERCAQAIQQFDVADAQSINQAWEVHDREWELNKPKRPEFATQDEYLKALKVFQEHKAAARRQWRARWEAALQRPPAYLLECAPVLQQRQGVLLDLALTARWLFPGGRVGRYHDGGNAAYAGWLTLAIAETRDPFAPTVDTLLDLTVLFVARGEYLDYTGPEPRRFRGDAGGRVVLAWDRFGFSVEVLGRWQLAGPSDKTVRVAGMVDYHLRSGIWATVSFGRGFIEPVPDHAGLIALLNLQANFGPERRIAPDAPPTSRAVAP